MRNLQTSKVPKLLGALNNFFDPKVQKPPHPLLFYKNYDSLVHINSPEKQLHLTKKKNTYFIYEAELGIKIGKPDSNKKKAIDYFEEYFIIVDITRRFDNPETMNLATIHRLKSGINLSPFGGFVQKSVFESFNFNELKIVLEISGKSEILETKMGDAYFSPELIFENSRSFSDIIENDVYMCGTNGSLKVSDRDLVTAKMMFGEKELSRMNLEIILEEQ